MMSSTSFYTNEELLSLGFKSIGNKCQISRKASFFDISKISIGDNVRIDDFCIISGDVCIGSNIHISSYVALFGTLGIELKDYSGVSSRSTIYSAMDDFSGEYLVGPIHASTTTNVSGGRVIVESFVQIGAHCVVFPNLTIGEGSVVGAMSLVKKSLGTWGVYAGIPVSKIKDRAKGMLRYVIDEGQ